MLKLKSLFTLLSASAVSTLSAAAGTQPKLPPAADAAPGIFTLSAGPAPITERTRVGERKLLVLEGEYAHRLGWTYGSEAANDGVRVAAGRAGSKTYDCGDQDGNGPGGGGCVPDTDDHFD